MAMQHAAHHAVTVVGVLTWLGCILWTVFQVVYWATSI